VEEKEKPLARVGKIQCPAFKRQIRKNSRISRLVEVTINREEQPDELRSGSSREKRRERGAAKNSKLSVEKPKQRAIHRREIKKN